ncbi:MAG: choice-of-anchor B family protein [Planctomycetota bacterium]|nr:choice-of-anchor B family protein [Planctomycetota bacterium]
MFIRVLVLLGAGTILLTGPAPAHENDPKADRQTPCYRGPGWREAEGGLAGDQFVSSGMNLRSWMPIDELDPASGACNDCWGYVSPTSREYAMIGTNRGTAFVEVSDPADPQLLQFHSGPTSTWRDIKVFGEYAYAVSEGGGGIQCFDLRGIDSGSVPAPTSVTTGGTASTHNVAINEESGYLYRCGGGSNIGLRVYDLKGDPLNPSFVGEWLERYVHDVQVVTYTEGPYAGREIAFCCAGFNNGSTETGLDVVDVTDKSNMFLVRRLTYPGGAYSHQGWLTPDRRHFLLGDELDEGGSVPTSVIVINVEAITNPFYVEHWTNGNTAVTHNVYTIGDFAYMANYTSGLRVFDIRDPTNLVEVGFIDTYPNDDGVAFDGLWSTWPYFPSGTVIGSDIQRGLFVITPDLANLGFSLVEPLPTTIPSVGAQFEFDVDSLVVGVDPSQVFVTVDDGSGPVTRVAEALTGTRFRATLPALSCPSNVQIVFSARNLEGELFSSAPLSTIVADEFPTLFSDDFQSGNGWSVLGSAQSIVSGMWMRGPPIGNGDWGDPTADFDGSGRCFLTGNGPGVLEVDGEAILMSPRIDGSQPETYITYARWFANDFGSWPNQDSMYVEVSSDDGATWAQVEQVGPSGEETSGQWFMRTFRVADFVPSSDEVRVRFRIEDILADSVLEGAIDAFSVETILCDDGPPPADLDSNGAVNGADLTILLAAWGTNDPLADLNGDRTVGGADLAILLAAWGSVP